ncbi:centromere protein M-like [Brienomyrus brachyistius]|uniref:centromere protein M-like n=1 Tax=Brienomyrus brachyistius TaxID=42636 RepID=UPI0020B1D228|nr:centromere protein M-like [Brienomyrus brachyistius]XP_048870608.1 centromere protein M-like [Brienomyrus brachyistius]
MSSIKPFSKLPQLNTANVLLVENEGKLQNDLADAIVRQESNINVTVRLARGLPLPAENEENRPRIDLVVFIVHLFSEHSLVSTENSLKQLDTGYFLGKVCFLVTGARCGLVPDERLVSLRKLAASLHCPLLFAEHQTREGVSTAAQRVLKILRVSAGLVPMVTGLYLSSVSRCTVPLDSDGSVQD